MLEDWPPYLQCPECLEHYFDEPFLPAAFASVGIEHGKSSYEMAESYFGEYHRKKHSDPA